MYQAIVYRIMIAAPSDINDEITTAFDVMSHWNDMHSEQSKLVLLPLHWSISSYPAMGKHPQKLLNEQIVEKSDLLICVFCTRLGSPTDTDISGTIEEINEHRKAGKDVMIFFKRNVGDINAVDPDQLQQLKYFKEGIKKYVLWSEFDDATDFNKRLSDMLQLYINEHWLVNNPIEKDNITSTRIEFSDREQDLLMKWVRSKNGDLRIIGSGGYEHYMFGNDTYMPKDGKEIAEIKDFIERLKDACFIERSGNNSYILRKSAYDYVGNQLVNLSQQQQEILQIVTNNKDLTTKEISMKIGLSIFTTQRNLTALRNMGFLVYTQEGGRKNGKWSAQTNKL